jgi:predicted nucleic acid-binding protein
LETLFQTVYIPPAVVTELRTGSRHCPPFDPAQYSFIDVRSPQSIDPRIINAPNLHPGEFEAISLAVELRADAILLDEQEAREAARSLGLRRVGVLGLLIDAKAGSHVPAVAPLIDRLRREANFFVSDKLLRKALRLAGES